MDCKVGIALIKATNYDKVRQGKSVETAFREVNKLINIINKSAL